MLLHLSKQGDTANFWARGEEADQRERASKKNWERWERRCICMNIFFSSNAGFQRSPPLFSLLPQVIVHLPFNGLKKTVLTLCYKRDLSSKLRKKTPFKKIRFAWTADHSAFHDYRRQQQRFIFTLYAKRTRNPKTTVFWKITFFYLKQVAGTYRSAELQKAKR